MIVILTGASRGLGLSILRILLERNVRVTTLSRTITPELQQLSNDNLQIVQGDVGLPQDNQRAIDQTIERWGGIDGLILNAGSINPARLADLDLAQASEYVSTNLLSVLYMVQPALPFLRKSSGRVVLVSSGASSKGYTSWGLYSMAKAGMNSLARTLANEEKGLSVWAVRPGLVDTSMQTLLRSVTVMDENEHVKFIQAHAKGQLLDPVLPGSVIAGLALDGPHQLSGEYIEWSDERLMKYRQ